MQLAVLSTWVLWIPGRQKQEKLQCGTSLWQMPPGVGQCPKNMLPWTMSHVTQCCLRGWGYTNKQTTPPIFLYKVSYLIWS